MCKILYLKLLNIKIVSECLSEEINFKVYTFQRQ